MKVSLKQYLVLLLGTGVLLVFADIAFCQQVSNAAAVPTTLTLDLATQILLARNPTILRERQNIAIARADIAQAQLRPNPQFELNSESYPLFDSHPGPFFQNNELLARVGQPIETAGKRHKRTMVAQQDLAVAESLLKDVIRQTGLELRTRYYRVVLAKAQLELAQQALGQFDEIIRLDEARFQRGDLSGLDLDRVQTERSRFFDDQVTAEVDLQNSKTALLELLGSTDMSAPVDVKEDLTFQPFSPGLEELEQEALVSRPDLLARQEEIERGRRALLLEKASAVPDIFPFAGYKRDFSENTVEFGINISLPIFNRNQGGIARAAAQVQQAGFDEQQGELAVRSQVVQAFQVVQGQERRVRELESTYVPKASQARDIAQASYRLGSLDLLGFLDAERAYRETLRAYNQTLFDHQMAVFLLQAAAGRER